MMMGMCRSLLGQALVVLSLSLSLSVVVYIEMLGVICIAPVHLALMYSTQGDPLEKCLEELSQLP